MGRVIFTSLGLLVVAFSLSGIGANCPFDWFFHDGSCYKLFNRWLSWDEAQRFCTEDKENGQLASIKDAEESVMLSKKFFKRLNFLDVWIGLRLSPSKGIWEWSDGSNVTYTSWEEGEPNNFLKWEFCAVLSRRSSYLQWNDKICRMHHHFVCKYQPRSQAAS